MVDQVDDGNATEERDVGTVWGRFIIDLESSCERTES